jgi:hypothetical protein
MMSGSAAKRRDDSPQREERARLDSTPSMPPVIFYRPLTAATAEDIAPSSDSMGAPRPSRRRHWWCLIYRRVPGAVVVTFLRELVEHHEDGQEIHMAADPHDPARCRLLLHRIHRELTRGLVVIRVEARRSIACAFRRGSEVVPQVESKPFHRWNIPLLCRRTPRISEEDECASA